jgi:LPXTG-site transpeptidase (sortase) family protein
LLIMPPNTNPSTDEDSARLAADVIRAKVARLYSSEPDALLEEREAAVVTHRSKHQQFMIDLSASGKDLATIQTEWHTYYLSLPETDKHQVWQEFYDSQSSLTQTKPTVIESAHREAEHKHAVAAKPRRKTPAKRSLQDMRSPAAIQAVIRDTVTGGGQLTAKHHLQSVLFGLGMGGIVVVIFLFSFFNEVVIAPFIQPSRVAAATPLIVSANSVAPTKNPEVIIPKINVEIPVNYTEKSTVEANIENDLESGVVHYPTTVRPGENGNAAFFGHSSNNILNPGKYKFAFVLLHTMIPGDTFYLTYNSKVFVYKVISKTVVDPSDVGVLGPVPGQTATATLITCDPPGTSLRRLVLIGQQISPAVDGNSTPAPVATTAAPVVASALPGNGPTLFSRIIKTTLGKLFFTAIVLLAIVGTALWVRKPFKRN